MIRKAEMGSLKTNSLIMIDGEPCKIVSAEKSKPGKHGSAKVRIVAIGMFDDVKRSITSPVSASVDVPLVEKSSAHVVSVGDTIQLMDTETYKVFETTLPEEEDLRSRLEPGVEVDYWNIVDRKKIVRIK